MLRYYNISYNDVYPSFHSEFCDLIDNNHDEELDSSYNEDYEDIEIVDDDSNAYNSNAYDESESV